jgi:hypothetical protein
MKSMAKWMLSAADVAGGLGLAATPAKAAQWGVYIGQSTYVPPCPGPGYEWTAGYYSDGYWVPGRWAFVGYNRPVVRYYGERYYHRDRDWDHDRRDRDHDRHDRGEHRGWDHDHR